MPKTPKEADDARRQWTGGGNQPKPATKQKTPATIEERLRSIIADELCIEEVSITRNASMERDLGADSLDIVELAMAVEEHFNIEISDDSLGDLDKFKDWLTLVERLTGKP